LNKPLAVFGRAFDRGQAIAQQAANEQPLPVNQSWKSSKAFNLAVIVG
jgi:hypothetical protein